MSITVAEVDEFVGNASIHLECASMITSRPLLRGEFEGVQMNPPFGWLLVVL